MNFFEILNKVLLELNYRPLETFEGIYKNEHQKILNAINSVNKEVLSSYDWPFMQKQALLTVPKGEKYCEVPFDGNFIAVFEGNKRLKFEADALKAINDAADADCYTLVPATGADNATFIVPKTPKDKENKDRKFRVFYYSKNYAVDNNGVFKPDLTGKDDISIIPMPYAEHILVYGSCLKIKANPSYPKFGFWNTLYIQALANLRQKSPQSKECEPFISIA